MNLSKPQLKKLVALLSTMVAEVQSIPAAASVNTTPVVVRTTEIAATSVFRHDAINAKTNVRARPDTTRHDTLVLPPKIATEATTATVAWHGVCPPLTARDVAPCGLRACDWIYKASNGCAISSIGPMGEVEVVRHCASEVFVRRDDKEQPYCVSYRFDHSFN